MLENNVHSIQRTLNLLPGDYFGLPVACAPFQLIDKSESDEFDVTKERGEIILDLRRTQRQKFFPVVCNLSNGAPFTKLCPYLDKESGWFDHTFFDEACTQVPWILVTIELALIVKMYIVQLRSRPEAFGLTWNFLKKFEELLRLWKQSTESPAFNAERPAVPGQCICRFPAYAVTYGGKIFDFICQNYQKVFKNSGDITPA